MRVLMTTDTVGGVWVYALELCRTLEARDVTIQLCAVGPPPSDEQRSEVEALPHVHLACHPGKLEWMEGAEGDLLDRHGWLLERVRAFEPDVVHLNDYAHAHLDLGAPVLLVAHSCVATWWKAVHGRDPPPRYDDYQRRVARGLRCADVVVAPTGAFLDELGATYGELGPARVIPNARDPTRFRPAPAKEAYVLGTGRLWDEAKNLGALDAAAASLSWPVRIAGTVRHPERNEPAQAHHAELLGRLPQRELEARYARASIFAHPACYEVFGLAPLEAAHAGCTLVLGDVPTLREVWGEAALYVPPDDPLTLQHALERLIDDHDLRAEMRARARERATRYVPERLGDDYEATYEDLAEGAREAPVVREEGPPWTS